jgi:hypothetical protein
MAPRNENSGMELGVEELSIADTDGRRQGADESLVS